jgi:hypothetical protein
MTAEQLKRLSERLSEVRNTDDLLQLEMALGPFDEEDGVAAQALFRIAATRCQLARGPAPAPESFMLTKPAPEHARERFEVRGRLDNRIVRVGWADGTLFGSLYALARLGRGGARHDDATTAREHIVRRLDAVTDERHGVALHGGPARTGEPAQAGERADPTPILAIAPHTGGRRSA